VSMVGLTRVTTRMPLKYAEKINAARSGMARAAEKSGRDSIRQ